jgi:glycosyltransferase involved in cell wall biosynthesis
MACGTPVIAYPEGSVPEVIDEGTTSFMVRSTDEAGAALGKARMLDRTALRQRFEQRFSAQRMASDYVALYRRLACTARFRPLISLPHVRRAPQIEVGAR